MDDLSEEEDCYGWPCGQERISLPPEMMRIIVSYAVKDWNRDGCPDNSTAGIRLASKGLKEAFDDFNTRIMLGGRREPWEGSKPLKPGSQQELQVTLLGILRHTPCLKTLVLQPWLPTCASATDTGSEGSDYSCQDALLHLEMSHELPELPPSTLCPNLRSLQRLFSGLRPATPATPEV